MLIIIPGQSRPLVDRLANRNNRKTVSCFHFYETKLEANDIFSQGESKKKAVAESRLIGKSQTSKFV
jgi:hypothetical protein